MHPIVRRAAAFLFCTALALAGQLFVTAGPASAGQVGVTVSIQGSGYTEVVEGSIEDGASGICNWMANKDERVTYSCPRFRNEEAFEAWVWLRPHASTVPSGHWRFVDWVGCDTTRVRDGVEECGVQSGVFSNDEKSPKAIFADDFAPTVSAVTPVFSTTIERNVSYLFSADEGQLQCRFDAEVSFSNCSSGIARTYGSEGPHTISVRAVDQSGQISGTSSHTATVVDTAIAGGPSGLVNSRSATFSFTSGAGTSFMCSLDSVSAYVPCGSTGTFGYGGLPDGVHTFRVYAQDGGWFDRIPAVRTWTVDATPPDTALTSTQTEDGTASFAFTGSGTGFECRLSGPSGHTWQSGCASPRSYTGLAEGAYTFEVRAKDAAGNVDQVPAQHSWTIDLTDPETTLLTPAIEGSSASFSFESEPGATFECWAGLAEGVRSWTPCSSPAQYVDVPEGSYVFEVRATDTAGNVEDVPVSRSWTVDLTAPQTIISSGPGQGAFVLSTAATLGLVSSEAGSTFACKLDGGSTSCPSQVVKLTNLSHRTHLFTAAARDARGNADPTPASRYWTVPLNNTELAHSRFWTKRTSMNSYLGTYSQTSRKGAALSKKVTGARKVALVATKAPGHGKVRLFAGQRLLTTVSLAATSQRTKQVIPVTRFSSPFSGTLRVVVITAGKTVRIEGLGVSTR